MLKGWVLTDKSCNTPGCTVPLMRSPNGRSPVIELCVRCEENPAPTPRTALSIQPPTSVASGSETSDTHPSRASTPPTEMSSALSSPVFAPPAETEESRRRREQSDTASAEIGKRLLKGWAMLGDECLNARCYGVPLVRPPTVGGDRDPREECVICGTVYTVQPDSTGRERLIPVNSINTGPALPRSNNAPSQPQERTSEADPWAATLVQPLQSTPIAPRGNLDKILDQSSQSLQSSLQILSTKVSTLSGSQSLMDLTALGSVAETLTKVTQALSQVRQLQRDETQNRAG